MCTTAHHARGALSDERQERRQTRRHPARLLVGLLCVTLFQLALLPTIVLGHEEQHGPRQTEAEARAAVKLIGSLPIPARDPATGEVMTLWRDAPRTYGIPY